MADNNKAVGSLAAAKLVTLIKAETGKKYDKTGGKIEGSVEITGGLKVGMSSEFSSSIKAGSEISSDMLLMAPTVELYDPAKEESISFGVSGENAAKVTSPVSGGGVQYARLAVGTPTGDNDAATKAYVDAAAGATVYVDFWPTSSDVEYIETFKAYVADLAASQTFDSVFDLVNTGNTVVARLYDNSNKANLVAESIETGISGDKELGNINFLFMNAATGTPFGLPTISDAIWLTKTNNNTVAYALYRYCPLPLPASDNSDTGKVPTINGKKWELKKPESTTTVDDAMSNTSTNPVQNKVIKKYVDDRAVRYDAAQSLTFEQKQRARKNIEAADREWPTITGGVSLCPEKITDSNTAVHTTTTTASGDDFTLTLDGGPENAPVRVKGIRTPTDADTNAAANVEYVKTKISEVSASGGVDVDNALSDTSTNPVQNKVVKTALDAKIDKSGGTFTGNIYGKYFCGTWLQSTAASDLGRTPGRIAVLDDSGWVYYRTPSEILNDIGGASKEYVDDHATGDATKVTISGTIEGEVSGYTSATYQEIVNEIAKNCNIWLTIDGETIRLASWKRSGSAAYKLVFFGAGSGSLTVKYEVTASASSATLTVTGG